jgi:hypothetical protein
VGIPHFQKPFFLQASAPVINNVQKKPHTSKTLFIQSEGKSIVMPDPCIDHLEIGLFDLALPVGRRKR